MYSTPSLTSQILNYFPDTQSFGRELAKLNHDYSILRDNLTYVLDSCLGFNKTSQSASQFLNSSIRWPIK
ncbi:hypothetical protein HKD37_09G025450 [Glycine soja]